MKTIKKWTSQEDATLQRMAAEGTTLQKIATELDRSPMAVLLRTRSLSGLESPLSKRRMDDEYYDQSKTITQVAPEFGRRWSKEDGKMLQKRFLEGWNIFQLAEYFDRTPKAILRQLERQNSRAEDMETLFNHAKFFFGKKKVVRKQKEDQQKQEEEHTPTQAELRQMRNYEIINNLNQIIQDFDNTIHSFQESLEHGNDYCNVEGDPFFEIEKKLISMNIPESAVFKEVIRHLADINDYLENTQLDSRASMLIDIELLKARRQLLVQTRNRRIGLSDVYEQNSRR